MSYVIIQIYIAQKYDLEGSPLFRKFDVLLLKSFAVLMVMMGSNVDQKRDVSVVSFFSEMCYLWNLFANEIFDNFSNPKKRFIFHSSCWEPQFCFALYLWSNYFFLPLFSIPWFTLDIACPFFSSQISPTPSGFLGGVNKNCKGHNKCLGKQNKGSLNIAFRIFFLVCVFYEGEHRRAT